MSFESAQKAREHNLALRFNIAHGQDTDHGVAEVIDVALNCVLTHQLDDEVLEFVRTFPTLGASGAIGFIRQRLNAALLKFETELLTHGG